MPKITQLWVNATHQQSIPPLLKKSAKLCDHNCRYRWWWWWWWLQQLLLLIFTVFIINQLFHSYSRCSRMDKCETCRLLELANVPSISNQLCQTTERLICWLSQLVKNVCSCLNDLCWSYLDLLSIILVGVKFQKDKLMCNRQKFSSFAVQKWAHKAVERSLPVPVRERHHDVEWCQEEDEMKETVAVCYSIRFIISRVMSSMLHVSICSWAQYSQQICASARPGEHSRKSTQSNGPSWAKLIQNFKYSSLPNRHIWSCDHLTGKGKGKGSV